MIVTITANLDSQNALIIAKEKWYNEKVSKMDIDTNTSELVDNPMSCFEFLQNVYVWMIKEDVTSAILSFKNKQVQESRQKEENEIRKHIENSLNSTLEV